MASKLGLLTELTIRSLAQVSSVVDRDGLLHDGDLLVGSLLNGNSLNILLS